MRIRNTLIVFLTAFAIFNPLTPLVGLVTAQTIVPQSIEICFVSLDKDENILQTLPEDTSISIKLYTDPGHLVKGEVNSYGSNYIEIAQTYQTANRNLLSADGIDDSYCVTQQFSNLEDHEYTYTPAAINSNLDWLATRYNDQNSIDFVDPDIAFPYSGEWFDSIIGNEDQRNADADGHITMTADRLHRRLLVVSQLDENLPQYAVNFSDSVPTSQEYTLSTVPSTLTPGQVTNLRFNVQNMGELIWLPGSDPANINPVNVSYHWQNASNNEYVVYDGNRAFLNQTVTYTQNDSNIALQVIAPNEPGNYKLVIDLVHEGVTWFSAQGANTYTIPILVGADQSIVILEPQQSVPVLQSQPSVQMTVTATAGSYYTVKPYQGGNWHCGGYDCLTGIAEDYYQCSANGIPNNVSTGDLTQKCWWPIYQANIGLYTNVPPVYAATPWNYLQVGWVLYIPPSPFGGAATPPPPANSSNFGGVAGASTIDPYAGMYGSRSAWPKVTFDRWIAWDGSYKTDAIKWSETTRPQTPTITGIQTNSDGTAATIYGIAIPKNYPINVAVWNEFRYCWACGSGWEYKYQQGTAQHVKVVLFKNNWEYIGQLWNDRSDGRWSITLPLGTTLKSGDKVFAEVQIEADYTFSGLKWWSDTYETANFNLRNPKYTGQPYFGSGGGNSVNVPSVYVDKRSTEERAIDQVAGLLRSSGGSALTNVCGYSAKTYSNVYQGNSGAIIFVGGRAIYSYGGTWDTFQYYGDRCTRFGAPINNPYVGGNGPFNTPGAYQDFANGRIYWSWKYVGKFVYGAISNRFEAAGGTNSMYGWPTSEVYKVTENTKVFSCQSFEGGTNRRICDDSIKPLIQVYCDDYRSGLTIEAGYEQSCGTMLQNGLIKLPNVYVVTREKWGAKYRMEDKDPSVYNYFYRYPGIPLSTIYSMIVIHHTTDPQDEDIRELEEKMHNKSTEPAYTIGYHFAISKDGMIFEGRPLENNGDHAYPNTGKIGVVLMGDYEPRVENLWNADTPTEAQLSSLERLVDDLQDYFRISTDNILGHKEVPGNSTECPGNNLEKYVHIRIEDYAKNN